MMPRTWRNAGTTILSACLTAALGCGEEGAPTDAGTNPNAQAAGPGAGAPFGPPRGGGPGGTGGPSSPLREIMTKLAKGPNSLTPTIKKALDEDQPAWDSIQTQTKEYAKLAGDLAKHDPPKGTKESWASQTATYVGYVTELEKAVAAKDKSASLAAHEKIAGSCMTCHREHRTMGGPGGFGGPGGPGGPGGFGGRGRGRGGPGGPPPGTPESKQ